MKNITFRTPITYHGGKQKLVPEILPRIPEHTTYTECFAGGAAVFFAKPPALVEVLNDTNCELINFYRVLQNRFVDLERMVSTTLHSRRLHTDAHIVYNHPHLFDEVKRAWAVWVLSSQSFSAMIDGSWGYDRTSNHTPKAVQAKKERFGAELAERLQNVQLEATDARYVIRSRDTADTFHYIDPPYFNSDCGHYDGYSQEDFEGLLADLAEVKGKFLLSSYPSPVLQAAVKRYGWHMWSTEQKVSVNAKSGYLKRKVEVLTANYPL